MTEQFHEQTTDLGEQKFSLDFTLSPEELPLAGRVINEQGMSASEFVKSLDGFELLFFFLPTNAVIARGILDLKVNSSLDKEFEIPVQRVDDLQVYGGVLKPRTPLKIAPK